MKDSSGLLDVVIGLSTMAVRLSRLHDQHSQYRMEGHFDHFNFPCYSIPVVNSQW